jgi:hypothetical protein
MTAADWLEMKESFHCCVTAMITCLDCRCNIAVMQHICNKVKRRVLKGADNSVVV